MLHRGKYPPRLLYTGGEVARLLPGGVIDAGPRVACMGQSCIQAMHSSQWWSRDGHPPATFPSDYLVEAPKYILEIIFMKCTTICILTGFACILVLAAGCTSTPSVEQTTTPTATTAGTVPVTPVATVTTASFTGTWNASWSGDGEEHPSRMTLQQTGSSVEGVYNDGNGTIDGTVTGNRLVGTWSDYDGNETVSGSFEFVLSPDAATFTGTWADNLEGLAHATESWDGVRV